MTRFGAERPGVPRLPTAWLRIPDGCPALAVSNDAHAVLAATGNDVVVCRGHSRCVFGGPSGHTMPARHVCLAGAGRFASGGDEGRVRLWPAKECGEDGSPRPAPAESPTAWAEVPEKSRLTRVTEAVAHGLNGLILCGIVCLLPVVTWEIQNPNSVWPPVVLLGGSLLGGSVGLATGLAIGFHREMREFLVSHALDGMLVGLRAGTRFGFVGAWGFAVLGLILTGNVCASLGFGALAWALVSVLGYGIGLGVGVFRGFAAWRRARRGREISEKISER